MSHKLIVSLIAIILASVSHGTHRSHGWNYEKQDEWPAKYCKDAVSQSPIDLDQNTMMRINSHPLIFKNWDQEFDATMTNNGHTVHVVLSNSQPLLILGGALPGTFKLEQFHFHWGAEHTLTGKRQALEAHFVAYNTRYKSMDEALMYKEGIAVFAVLYEQSDKQNDKLKPIVDSVQKIIKNNQKTTIRINPTKLIPRGHTRFYRYWGSLTTPNCDDVVVWTVFSDLLPISQAQVKQFSMIKDHDGKALVQNFRFIQPLNGRMVYEVHTDDACCNGDK